MVTHHALSTLLVEFEDCGGTGKGANKGEMGVGMKARAESYLQGTFFFGGGRAVVTLGRSVFFSLPLYLSSFFSFSGLLACVAERERDKGLTGCALMIHRYLDEVRLTDVGWRVTNKTLIRTVSKPHASDHTGGCGMGFGS